MGIKVNGVQIAGVGKQGIPGKSAFDAAKEAGYSGTEENFNSKMANTMAGLSFKDVQVSTSAWANVGTYADYPYEANIACAGVTEAYIPQVNFSMSDALSGVFSPIAESGSGVVKIFASELPTSNVVIPSILCIEGVLA